MIKKFIVSIISGILIILSFPPFDLFFRAWIALIPLLHYFRKSTCKDVWLLYASSGIISSVGIYHSSLSYSIGFIVFFLIIFIIPEFYERDLITGGIAPLAYKTFYTRFGHLFPTASLLFVLFLVIKRVAHNKK